MHARARRTWPSVDFRGADAFGKAVSRLWSRTSPLRLPEATIVLSLLNVTAVTVAVWPVSVLASTCALRSQIFTSCAVPPVTR